MILSDITLSRNTIVIFTDNSAYASTTFTAQIRLYNDASKQRVYNFNVIVAANNKPTFVSTITTIVLN